MSLLPEEMLLKIFNFCDVYTLLQLNSVCKQFHRISNEVLTKKSERLLITNEMSKKFRERCKPHLSSYNSKFITYYNWKYRIYNKNRKNNFHIYPGLITKCLEMTKHTVWFYAYNNLYAYNRAENGNIEEDGTVECSNFPFSSIALCNDMIISGHSDGSITHWKIESQNNYKRLQRLKTHFNVYDNTILNIEVSTQHIISSSLNLIKIHKNILEEDGFVEENETIYRSRTKIRSISLNPTETKVAVCDGDSLLIFDINENCQLIHNKRINGDVCSKLLWQDPDTILMLYRHHIKKLDMRTFDFVRTWDAPFHDRLCSFSSDNLYTIMAGTNNGTVLLWDQRKSHHVIHIYNVTRTLCSPVLSMEFDSTHMYAVTQQDGLIEFDFKGADDFDRAIRKNYFSNFI